MTVEAPRALVKGGGPSGLAAAIALRQEGYRVTVVERRPDRPENAGRKNMVALRPEGMRRLEALGALAYAQQAGTLTPITEAATRNELDGSVFEWPLKRYPAEGYEIPNAVNEQVPSTFICLGNLEDHLTRAGKALGVEYVYDSTVRLTKTDSLQRYEAVIVSSEALNENTKPLSPDLVVCASGKSDVELSDDLGFERYIGPKLERENLPKESTRLMRLGPAAEIESQRFAIFGVRVPHKKMGVLDHVVRKGSTVVQPLTELEMNHAGTSHCCIQLPRGMATGEENRVGIERYVVERINERLGTSFADLEDMEAENVITWGDPGRPVIVETATAPTFVYGSNVVLVGDAAASCSPSSGLGAEIGLTVDSGSVGQLAKSLIAAGDAESLRDAALTEFNMRKAESAVMWSQGSSWFYITNAEAESIKKQDEAFWSRRSA